MKKLRFAPHLVPLVLNGSKTTTWRLFDDKDLQVGDEFEMLHSETQEKFATGKIISINITKFKNLTESDHKGHKSYNLVACVQLAIRVAVGAITPRPARELTLDDFSSE